MLELSPEEMRRLGYRIIDRLVEHFETLPEQNVTPTATRAALEARLREPLPERGMDPGLALDQLERDVWPYMMHLDHPRFFAFVPGPSNFVGALADALVAGLNPFAGTWLEAAGPAEIELVTIDWLRQLCGLPESAAGHFVSGGSAANLTALAVARHSVLDDRLDGAVVYCSDQTHASVDRALRLLGFGREAVRKLAPDGRFCLPLPALREAIEQDRAAGRRPFCVVANAGTTNTGAVDPLPGLAEICAGEGLWLHVDGSYGAAAAFSERGRAALAGIERADSLSLDPHKWLFQPYEIGCVLVRDARLLQHAFHVLPEYLEDAGSAGAEVNFWEQGLQLTRSLRALKLWLSLKVFGAAAFRAAIERGMSLAVLAERTLAGRSEWEIVSPAQLGIVAFRAAPAGMSPPETDALNQAIVAAAIGEGFAMVSSTTLNGRVALRMCTINPRTTDADIVGTVERLERYSRQLRGAAG